VSAVSVAKPSPAEITSISIGRLFPLIESSRVLVIDARPSIIHRFGHLPGSLNVPRSDATATVRRMNDIWVAARNESRPIVVYCTNRACPDAFAVASAIAALGHACSVFEGGWEEWKSAGLPVE
jgi:ArsR family transcriptional regulator